MPKSAKIAPPEIKTTPHIGAPIAGDKFGKVCICPGDPLRAKWMSDRFLKDAEQITNVRGIMGFTGIFEGEKISILASGMGMPSASIYWQEIITNYGVKAIIRTGTCGTVLPQKVAKTKAGDIILAIAAGTDSNMNRMRFSGWDFPASANYELLSTADGIAKNNK